MYASDVDSSNSKMYGGHTWAIMVPEADGTNTISCQVCHVGDTESTVNWAVTFGQGLFQALDATAQANVARAAAVLQNSKDTNWLATPAQAQHNLTYAESDESGGFHNFSYLMALLDSANSNALSIPILDVTMQGTDVVISWTGGGTLQSADSINGPWNDVPNATNPLVIPPVARAPQQFYQLRQ